MVISKHNLIESVIAERTVDDYLDVGGLPAIDTEEMDNEFYSVYGNALYDSIMIALENIRKSPSRVKSEFIYESGGDAQSVAQADAILSMVDEDWVKNKVSPKQAYEFLKPYGILSANGFEKAGRKKLSELLNSYLM